MAPIPDSVYFPSLDKCLSSVEQRLVSWKSAFTALAASHEYQRDDGPLRVFWRDAVVLDLLSKPFEIFSKPDAASKTAFGTRTAAINAPPADQCEYKLDQIKADALWLSKETGIDEVSALRIVILECQERPSVQLLAEFSKDEIASIHEVSGGLNTETSQLARQCASAGVVSTDTGDLIDSEEHRRLRALTVYLSERTYALKCALIAVTEELDEAVDANNEPYMEEAGSGSWMQDFRTGLAERIGLADQGTDLDTYILSCIDAARANFESLNRGCGWFKDSDSADEIELGFATSQITEAIHIIEFIFVIQSTRPSIASPQVVLDWFKFVASFGFFDGFQPDHPALQALVAPLQGLVSITSLSIMRLSESLQYLVTLEKGADNDEPSDESPYIMDLEAIGELQDIFIAAASDMLATAAPAIFAWVILLQSMRTVSVNQKETRELRQSQKAAEGFEGSASPGPADALAMAGRSSGRRSSVSSDGSLETGYFEQVMERVMKTPMDGDPIEYLAGTVVNQLHVFDVVTALVQNFSASPTSQRPRPMEWAVRMVLLSLIRSCTVFIDYIPEVVQALLTILDYPSAIQARGDVPNPIDEFLSDQTLADAFLRPAMARYPYESLPFLKLMRNVASCQDKLEDDSTPAAHLLGVMPSFTHELPNDFRGYEVTHEEENTNTIQLTEPISLFEPRNNLRLQYKQANEDPEASDGFIIPAGTFGRVVSDDGPKVVVWFYQYSGLAYFGRLLDTATTTGEYLDATTGGPLDRDSQAEVISLFATLLSTSTRIASSDVEAQELSQRILGEASDALGRTRGDIISVVFDIFGEELESRSSRTQSEDSLDVLLACTSFIKALIPVMPGRVWPLLGRSGLLNIDGRGGRLAAIVGSLEMVLGDYRFLLSCTELFEALVEDCVKHAALRRAGSKALVRRGSTENLATGVPPEILSKVLLSFTRTFIDVFQSGCNWKYAKPEQRLLLHRRIADIFHDVLRYTYGVDDSSPLPTTQNSLSPFKKDAFSLSKQDEKTHAKLTEPLDASAVLLVDSFLSTTDTLIFQPILRAFVDGFSTTDSTVDSQTVDLWTIYVKANLLLTRDLLKISTFLERPVSQLYQQVFKSTPLVTRIYACHDSYRLPVVSILEALVLATSRSPDEPPSLLGYLGARSSKTFLRVLSQFDGPLPVEKRVVSIWRLMSAVVSNRQQWFAIYLLTGRTPRESMKETPASSPVAEKSVLQVALRTLVRIDEIPLLKAMALLEFIALSQNFWPWAMTGLQKDSEVIEAISEFVGTMEPPSSTNKIEKSIDNCYRVRIASYIADILAMHLYHSRQIGQGIKDIKKLLINLDYYIRFGVAVPNYNESLHWNLKRNFENTYPGCSLENFKRTSFERKDFGRDYYYDIQLANAMLRFDRSWNGTKDDGLATELILANVNLSLVDAQIALLHSWKFMAIELSRNLTPKTTSTGSASDNGNSDLAKALTKVANDCLISNSKNQPPENIFERLVQTRADFAIMLVQRLVELGWMTELHGLLTTAWDTIRNLGTTFEIALSIGDAVYYRSLLKILFLALCAHSRPQDTTPRNTPRESTREDAERHKKSIELMNIIMFIINIVVARGFKDLTTAIHDNPAESSPEDIALITAIFQNCLRIPGIDAYHPQILDAVANNDTARTATTLFSWSDKLAIDGDPIYGELSMMFLLELSTVPALAEQLAIDGVLGHISNTNIVSYLRKANVSPFSEGAGLQRCYNIWVRGILPFLLNLLHAFGQSIAPEVAVFLNQFPGLLERSSKAFETPLSDRIRATMIDSIHIVLSNVLEIQSLALLNLILSVHRTDLKGIIDVPEIPWDNAGTLESVEYWLSSRLVLRERILPTGLKEMEMAKQKPLSAELECQNRLEERVVEELMSTKDILSSHEARNQGQ